MHQFLNVTVSQFRFLSSLALFTAAQDTRNTITKHGWAPRGERAYKAHVWAHGTPTSTFATMSDSGMGGWCGLPIRRGWVRVPSSLRPANVGHLSVGLLLMPALLDLCAGGLWRGG